MKKFFMAVLFCLPLLGQAQSTWSCEIQSPGYHTNKTVYNVDIISTEGVVQIVWDSQRIIAHVNPDEWECQSPGFTPTEEPMQYTGNRGLTIDVLSTTEILPTYTLSIGQRDGEPTIYVLYVSYQDGTEACWRFKRLDVP